MLELYLATVVLSPPYKPGNHPLTIVSNLIQAGDKWLVDVGFGGSPWYEAVNLDFQGKDESPVITQSFKTYKIIKRGDLYIYMHGKRTESGSHDAEELVWNEDYYFTLEKHTLEEIRQSLDKSVYSNPECFFNQGCLCSKWVDGRYVCVRDEVLLIEADDHHLQSTNIEDKEEFLKIIDQYFPEIEPSVRKQGLENLTIFPQKIQE